MTTRFPDAVAVVAVIFFLMLPVSVVAQSDGAGNEAATLSAIFIGNMAFEISDGETVLYTDFPYTSGAFGYMEYDLAQVEVKTGALSLVTHFHPDHWSRKIFDTFDLRLVGPPGIVQQVGPEKGLSFGESLTLSIGDLEIEAIPTSHRYSPEHYSYLVTWHGLRLYFTGDTESLAELKAARDLDVVFVSPWLLRELKKDGAEIDARKVVVYHHRLNETVPGWQAAIQPLQGQTLVLTD